MIKTLTAALAATAFGLSAEAATYSFDMTVQDVAVTGFFKVNSSSPNYVGGGTTTVGDLLDYSLTLSKGGNTFTAAPTNVDFIQTWSMTYSADLSSATEWDLSTSFIAYGGKIGIGGNNIYDGGIASILDMSAYALFNAFEQPPGPLTSRLITGAELAAPVPLPAGLPLVATALAALAVAGRRTRRSQLS